MIEIGEFSLPLTHPLVLVAAGVVALILILLILSLRRAGQSARVGEDLARQMHWLGQNVQQLGQGQEQLRGGLNHVSDQQASAQVQVIQTVEARLGAVQQQMNDRLHDNAMKSARALADMQERMKESLQGSAVKTTESLTQLQERLKVIDKAQDNITRLSGDVLSLQDILSNKQTRGAFGEIQLRDIVSKALPADSFGLQATLSNGKRADCLIHLPNPPGPIVIDSKFPLEAYEALVAASTEAELKAAMQMFRSSVRKHINDISDKYIIEGETADGALMFLPSEAVYAELHAKFPDLVQESFTKRVWIVSPTTCMATLNTMRAILKDARMREQAGAIRKELHLLSADVGRLGDRVANLDRHFHQASKDISDIKISAEKAGNRAKRLDNFDFEEVAAEDQTVVPIGKAPS
ncbi:DNA recombination protein RmuC [Aliiroseovarius crassostreae]|uniref:DNA recombination protein RmuC homolog n=1 Tax=Aliiroseovarius crassostreae TaxID=154981 RepID=A0A9Q9HCY3_9RHOB|nr:DNA recombination protein RmuC [Aliiroseovarius crassostreae]UWP91823.1 DNA recombination protein RmuC [Aliiroseovarius crassostreae]UWP94972.1 DNA recombination protein RmuC [Aliiroseovarius crassostreae]UWP98132.1 DNA recombination protein RmuC [Aliiroseovarius crassostreae]UWQ01316.1 DNA recombination protein RmuC [Aliiroseovarius crassostreae]